MAKAKLEITDRLVKEVMRLAGLGLTNIQMAYFFEIEVSTWKKYIKKYKVLREAVDSGKALALAFVAGQLMKQCEKGNIAAIIFYLKTQGKTLGYYEHNSIGGGAPAKDPDKIPKIETTDPIQAAKIYQQIIIGS